MTKKGISLSTLGALACGSIIVLVAWTYDTAAQIVEEKKPYPVTNPGPTPGVANACAPGFKRVNQGGDFYSCEMVGSTKRVCLSNLWQESSLGIENNGKDGWKISYSCALKPK